MSLIDQILSQKVIVISASIALLLLLVAIGMVVASWVRTQNAKRRRQLLRENARRAALQAQQAAQSAEVALQAAQASAQQNAQLAARQNAQKSIQPIAGQTLPVGAYLDPAASTASTAESLVVPIQQDNATVIPTAQLATPGAVATVPATSAPTDVATPAPADPSAPAAGTQPAAEPSAQPAGSMQDILSSIFTDEDATARYEVLLHGLENVPVSDLVLLCQKVTKQLRISGVPKQVKADGE